MGVRRLGTLVIMGGGVGLLVGRILLARFPGSDTFARDVSIPQVWTDDGDLHLSLGLNVLLFGLAAWHLHRFGLGKLIVIGLLAAGAFQLTLFDFGDGAPFWSEGYSGDELIGGWLMIASAVVVLIGVVWSYVSERPAEITFSSYFFSEGPSGGGGEPAQRGIMVDGGQPPPPGWWLASDGRWYPPEQHAERVPPPPGPQRRGTLRLRRRWVVVIGVVVASWVVGQFFNSSETPSAELESADDQRSVQGDAWRIELDGDRPGVHIIHMVKTFGPLEEVDVQELGGRLVWPETDTELCSADVAAVGDGFVQIAAVFPTAEECPGMGQAFEDFGLPETACLFVRSNGADDEYCAPLDVVARGITD